MSESTAIAQTVIAYVSGTVTASSAAYAAVKYGQYVRNAKKAAKGEATDYELANLETGVKEHPQLGSGIATAVKKLENDGVETNQLGKVARDQGLV